MLMTIVGVAPVNGTKKDGTPYYSLTLYGTYKNAKIVGEKTDFATVYGDSPFYPQFTSYFANPEKLIGMTLMLDRDKRGYVENVELLQMSK